MEICKVHELKLSHEFVDAVLDGSKSFEVRNNDRGFQKGEFIVFKVVGKRKETEPIEKKLFRITYVLSGWHIEPGYVVLGLKAVGT